MSLAPGEEDLYDLLDSCDRYSGYSERIEDGFTYMGMGVAGPIFLLQTFNLSFTPGNLRNTFDTLRQGYRICGVLGVNMRVVDDLMDGDNVIQVQDRENLWSNYIESLSTGELPDPVEIEDERIAYRAGQVMNTYSDQEVIEEIIVHLHRLRELLKEEDKSTEEGYRRYAKGFGGEYGKMLLTAMKNIEEYKPSEKDYEFARDYGKATQIADDKFDDDIGLDQNTLNKIYKEYLNDLLQHKGIIPTTIGNLGLRMPKIYNILMYTAAKIEKIK